MQKIKAGIRRFLSKKLLIPYVISIVALVTAVILFLSLWFMLNVRDELTQCIYDKNALQTRESAYVMENTLMDLDLLACKVLELGELSPGSFRRDMRLSYNAISYFNSGSHKFDDMIIYYPGNPLVLTVYGTCSRDLYFSSIPDASRLIGDITASTSKRLLTTLEYGEGLKNARLFYVYPIPLNSRNPQYYLLFSLNSRTLNSLICLTDETEALLTGMDGHTLWSSSDRVLESAPDMREGSEVVMTGQRYLSSGESIRGICRMTTFSRVTSQFDRVDAAWRTVLAFCVVLFLTGVALILWSVKRGYRPIEQIIAVYRKGLASEADAPTGDLDTLRHMLSRYQTLIDQPAPGLSEDMCEELFVLSAINGRLEEDDSIRNVCGSLISRFSEGECFVLLALFDEAPGEGQRSLLMQALSQEEGQRGCLAMQAAENCAVCVLSAPIADAPVRAGIAWRILNILDMGATCAVGSSCDDLRELNRSYLEAYTALNDRFIRGCNTVLLYDELPAESRKGEYPAAFLSAYASALKTWNVELIDSSLSALIEHLNSVRLNRHESNFLCFELIRMLMDAIHTAFGKDCPAGVSARMEALTEFDSVRDLTENIRQLCREAIAAMQERATRDDETFIGECRKIIEENIGNASFALETIAEHFGITPQFLRRRFKQLTGDTLISTMAEARISRAKRLLTETDLEISEIMRQVGYLDGSSFSRTFRNAAGMSPTQFREATRGTERKRNEGFDA